jgi:hypothetical protein
MRYYKPSTIGCSPLVLGRGPTTVCRTCGDTMKHFRTIFRLGVRPEKFMFRALPAKGAIQRKSRWWPKGASVGTPVNSMNHVRLRGVTYPESEISCVSISVASSTSNFRNRRQ